MRDTSRVSSLCCSIPLEGAVTALGNFQASLSVAAILVVLRQVATLLFRYRRSDYPGYMASGYPGHVESSLLHIQYLIFWLLVLGLSLMLAVFLLIGVKKRRPGYVLTYLLSSLMAALVLTGYWLYCVSSDHYFIYYDGAIEVFLILFLYSLCLIMVYLAYRKITLEATAHIYNILHEDHYCVSHVQKKIVV